MLVTGGAGFIGSALVRHLLDETEHHVLNVDKLTYAGNLASLPRGDHPRYGFLKLDITEEAALHEAIEVFAPDAVIHLAAESHVDRSIDGPAPFMQSNVSGTFSILEALRRYLANNEARRAEFRLIHVSTDEVFGDLALTARPFDEHSPYRPSSPYSASKAASDHLVQAWGRTYGIPAIITHASNNYGPYQFPEKLIPKTILNALAGTPIPLYGNGAQTRDWLHVTDHVRALMCVLERGRIGKRYLIGSGQETSNRVLVETLCRQLDRLVPTPGVSHERLITPVEDRPGHDVRYALDHRKTVALGWQPSVTLEAGLLETVQWYLNAFEGWSGASATTSHP
ncbi:dTDP-glucose 4,6-dehydratase [Larsenimonas suaedae]|uniref:dTDP-glucose 4,6-dehydratase n=1 Tax=Larsenimonas suaedae TaxID=1851019 RepID=A0ABU1GWK7_9GAMM|nr:dTDP-glucose 4,6-dehydratase [Larsenimonas suaedae]MCM2972977.1 dTDP-glucose 4,6-dehydratase [Larsenimonas suaedae]MDR5896414.1 dTDP-glucose 4,6-dehydratase [Larsenimonas suaedae]